MEIPEPPLTPALPVVLDALPVLLLWALPDILSILLLNDLRDEEDDEEEEEEVASDSGVASIMPSRSLTKSKHSHNITHSSPKSIRFTWADTTSTSPPTDRPNHFHFHCYRHCHGYGQNGG